MTIATRAELITEITSYLWDRSDVVARIPTFIKLAEAQMQRRLSTRRKVGKTTFAIDSEYEDVPTDFAGVVSFELTTSPVVRLISKTPDQLVNERDSMTTLTGEPYCYAIIGGQFRFFFAPNQAYSSTLIYWQKFTALVNDNDTNWVLTDHPDAYLYGALLQSAPWLHEDERVPVWAALFKQVLDDIVEQDKNEQPGSALQMSPSTYIPI